MFLLHIDFLSLLHGCALGVSRAQTASAQEVRFYGICKFEYRDKANRQRYLFTTYELSWGLPYYTGEETKHQPNLKKISP